MFNRGILWLRSLYRSAARRVRFLLDGPPANYAILYRGRDGEVLRDNLLNIVSQREHLAAGILVFVDIDGHASYYSTSVVLRVRRRVGIEQKRLLWPQADGAAL